MLNPGGAAHAEDAAGIFNQFTFVATRLINKIVTMKLVQVVAVYPNASGQGGTVDLQPLVNQISPVSGMTQPHGIVNNVPYQVVGGGDAAVLITPAVGDIGMAVAADRDTSAVVANAGSQSNPGSLRKHNLADAIYIGKLFGAAATQFIQFAHAGGGITMKTPGPIALLSSTLTHNGKNVGATHDHSGVQTGGGVSGPPV